MSANRNSYAGIGKTTIGCIKQGQKMRTCVKMLQRYSDFDALTINGADNSAAALRRSSAVACQGFTLLETLIVISIAAIVITIAVPSFKSSIAGNRLTTTANAYVGTFNNARLSAMQRNSAVQYCGGSVAKDGNVVSSSCGSESGAAYLLRSDGTASSKLTAGPVTPGGITSATQVALRFNGQGIGRNVTAAGNVPYSGLLLDISTNQITVDNRRCIYVATGSIISVCSVSGGACSLNAPTTCQ